MPRIRPSPLRDAHLNVRMLPDEMVMLERLAEREGMSVSGWVRHVIRTSHRRAFGEPTQVARKRK